MLSRQAENASLCCTALSQIQESEPQIFLLLSSKYLRSAFASIALGMEQFFFCCHIYPDTLRVLKVRIQNILGNCI